MIEIITIIINIYVFINNIKIFNGILVYIPITILLGFIIYSLFILNQKKQYVVVKLLKMSSKLLMIFSIAISILGFYMTYAKPDMQGFDRNMNKGIFLTGLINFILCCFSYYLLLFTKTNVKKRIK